MMLISNVGSFRGLQVTFRIHENGRHRVSHEQRQSSGHILGKGM